MHDAFLQTLKCTVHTRASYDTLESAWDFNMTVYLQKREREREREILSRERERETDRQTERERESENHRERKREREREKLTSRRGVPKGSKKAKFGTKLQRAVVLRASLSFASFILASRKFSAVGSKYTLATSRHRRLFYGCRL